MHSNQCVLSILGRVCLYPMLKRISSVVSRNFLASIRTRNTIQGMFIVFYVRLRSLQTNIAELWNWLNDSQIYSFIHESESSKHYFHCVHVNLTKKHQITAFCLDPLDIKKSGILGYSQQRWRRRNIPKWSLCIATSPWPRGCQSSATKPATHAKQEKRKKNSLVSQRCWQECTFRHRLKEN